MSSASCAGAGFRPNETSNWQADVVLVGGGVIGCASALALREAGADVLVIEQSVPGAEASSTAAGILGAQAEAREPGPFAELAQLSLALYPELAALLRDLTGIDVEFRRCGVIEVADEPTAHDRLRQQAAWQRAAGRSVSELDGGGIARCEPRLAKSFSYGVHFAHDARIDPKALVRALHGAAQQRGARFCTGTAVRRVRARDDGRCTVDLASGAQVSCAHAVVTAGSWSGLIDGVPQRVREVVPVRGQIVELRTLAPVLTGVVFGPHCYLVPRDDGRVLVGSTLEFVGHQRAVTAGAVRDLLNAAIALVPELANAQLVSTWSGFRPYPGPGLPLLGATSLPNVLVATGHHRNGILLAPITAAIVKALVTNVAAPLDLAPFAPG